jgi:hypothetical protein
MEGEERVNFHRLARPWKLEPFQEEEWLAALVDFSNAAAQRLNFVDLVLGNHEDAPQRTWLMNDSQP